METRERVQRTHCGAARSMQKEDILEICRDAANMTRQRLYQMSLVKLGRARLSLVLPYHREQLRAARNPTLYDLFESYALAAQTLDRLLTEHRRREELINEYQALCLDMQAEVIALLKQIELAAPQSRTRGFEG